MYKKIISISFILFFSLNLIGCSRIFRSSKLTESSVVQTATPQSPFEVKIINEQFDGNKLTVTANLKSAYDWEADKAIVILRSLEDGEVLNETTKTLSIIPSIIKSGEVKPVNLEVFAGGMTDYQLELEWGVQNTQSRLKGSDQSKVANLSGQPNITQKNGENEINEIRAGLTTDPKLLSILQGKKDQDISLGTVSIENNVSNIGKPKAEIGNLKVTTNAGMEGSYQVQGELFNAGTSLLKRVLIGITLGEVSKKAEIKNLHLEPGDSKKLILTVKGDGITALSADNIKLNVLESN